MCCSGLLKMMMFIFNGCIFVAGAVILGVGVWVKVDSGSLLGVLDSIEDAPAGLAQLANVAYLLIGVGAVLLIMGFLGCCGAVKESRCMLLTFFIIILIIFIAEVTVAVVILVFEPLAAEFLQGMESQVRKSIRKDFGESESVTSLWNATMEEFQCCGFMNYTDFENSKFFIDNSGSFPTPCCNSTIIVSTCNREDAESSNIEGCSYKLLQLIEDNALLIGAAALGIAAIEVAAMVVSMTLYKRIGNKRRHA